MSAGDAGARVAAASSSARPPCKAFVREGAACLSQSGHYIGTMTPAHPSARFTIGEVVRHRLLDFRGVIFDVDPEFANSEEWYQAIPEHMRPAKEQPFYHLLAENADSSYVAYVSQQNLVLDDEAEEVDHPAVGSMFEKFDGQRYSLKPGLRH